MKKIVKTIFYIYFPAVLIASILKLTSVLDPKTFISIFVAILLNLANLFVALLFFHLSKKRSNQLFMLLNLGGMGVRVFFLLLGFSMVLIFLEIDKYAFILVFLILYSVSIYTEIKFFYNEVQKKRE